MTHYSDTEHVDEQLYDAVTKVLSSLGTVEALNAPEQATFPDLAWKTAAQAGWFRTLVPEEEDGLGLGLVELAAVFRAVGRGLFRGPLPDVAVAVPALLAACPRPLRPLLHAALDGESVVVVADPLAEPYRDGAGGFVAADGMISGRAELVPFASSADVFVVHAATADGPALIAVEAGRASVRALSSADPCTDYGLVELAAVRYEAGDVLAHGEAAVAVLALIRDQQRLMIAAELAGTSAALVGMATAFSQVRQQFGRPIAGFQALRHMLAVIATKSSALGNLVDASVQDATTDPAQLASAAAIAKAYASITSKFIAEETLQIHGGVGFTTELPMHLYFRRVLSNYALAGEPDDLLLDIGYRELAATTPRPAGPTTPTAARKDRRS